MKQVSIFLFLILIIFSIVPKETHLKKALPVIDVPNEIVVQPTHQMFLDSLGKQESGNRYDIVNKYGMLGRYQFSKTTLKGLGFKITPNEFLNNPSVQEEAMTKLLQENKRLLKKQLKKYNGKTVDGIVITESGLLAAAHLAGAGSVKKWLRTNGKQTRTDGFGTTIEKYLQKFSNFKLNI